MMDIQEKLYEWGRWSNSYDCGTGFKPIWEAIERCAPHVDKASVKRRAGVALMDDIEAMKIDKAVARLTYELPLLAKIIKKIYLRQNTIEEVARYVMTPIEFPEQVGMDWDDLDKKKFAPKSVRLLLNTAHDVIERELDYIEQEYFKNG